MTWLEVLVVFPAATYVGRLLGLWLGDKLSGGRDGERDA